MQPFSCGNSVELIQPCAWQIVGTAPSLSAGIVRDAEAGIHLVIRVNLVEAACRNEPGAL
jgi:hypothetical protein